MIAGNNLTYTIGVDNKGPSHTGGTVTLTDQLPAGTTLVSATPSQGTCSGTTTVTCDLGTLANGASATVSVVVHVDRVGRGGVDGQQHGIGEVAEQRPEHGQQLGDHGHRRCDLSRRAVGQGRGT